jgi:CubicO group peptidase (beta-lactamase class C family)
MKKLILLSVLAMPVLATAQSIAQKADELLSLYTKQNQFAGNVLIAEKNKIIFEKAYGYADAANKRMNTLQTEFRAGSLTKMFTSVLILQLAEAGKLKLTDPVSKYAPNINGGDKITIKNLLSHTSGIAGNTPKDASNARQLVEGFKNDKTMFEPGTRFEYNNFNFVLLSYIAEKITGISYPQLMQQRVFAKAGMTHSGIDNSGRKSADVALGHTLDQKSKQLVTMGTANVSAASGAGAMYTTVGDLYKFYLALKQNKVLFAKSKLLALTPVQVGYGLGWMINNNDKHYKIGHTGSIEGFRADFMMFPKEDKIVVFLSNLLPPTESHVERALTAITFNEPYQIETAKKEIILPPEMLAKYIGTYTSDGGNMVVSVNDGKLLVLAPGGDTAELSAMGDNKFFVKGPEILVVFKEDNSKVNAMDVDIRGGITFKRLN